MFVYHSIQFHLAHMNEKGTRHRHKTKEIKDLHEGERDCNVTSSKKIINLSFGLMGLEKEKAKAQLESS